MPGINRPLLTLGPYTHTRTDTLGQNFHYTETPGEAVEQAEDYHGWPDAIYQFEQLSAADLLAQQPHAYGHWWDEQMVQEVEQEEADLVDLSETFADCVLWPQEHERPDQWSQMIPVTSGPIQGGYVDPAASYVTFDDALGSTALWQTSACEDELCATASSQNGWEDASATGRYDAAAETAQSNHLDLAWYGSGSWEVWA